MWWDILFAIGSVAVAYYILSGGDDLFDRNTAPNSTDVMVGAFLIAIILESVRRTNGMVLVVVTSLFLLYALFGNYFTVYVDPQGLRP